MVQRLLALVVASLLVLVASASAQQPNAPASAAAPGPGSASPPDDKVAAAAKAEAAAACQSQASDMLQHGTKLASLGVTTDQPIIAGGRPIMVHVTLPAGLQAPPTASGFQAAGMLSSFLFGEGKAFPLFTRSWLPPSDNKPGDLVFEALDDHSLNTLDVQKLRIAVVLCGTANGAAGETQAYVSVDFLSAFLALAITVGFYVLGALSVSAVKGWQRFNPLWLTFDGSGRASLSNMQILFFSVIVLYLVAFILLRTGVLAGLSGQVLALLGIAGAGSVGGKVATYNTRRLSFDNWAWIKRKGWTTESGNHVSAPRWGDLVTTDDDFDPYKFQMLSFSFVIGISLLILGVNGLVDFAIPPGLLGVIGLSQVTYVGGTVFTPGRFGDLDDLLTNLRSAEQTFITKTATAWAPPTPPAMALATAINSDPGDYQTFKSLVGPAYTMFAELFTARGPKPNFEPGVT